MKKFFKIWLFLIFQSFTLNMAAETAECAIKNDKVEEYSFEICQEDESFRLLYEIFPRLFEEGLFIFGDFGDIEKLKDNPEIALDNQYKKFSNLMYELFRSMTTLITYLITFFIFYSAFFSLLKASEEGGFVDYNRESLLKMAGYGGVTVFLLLPVGELITAQILLLFISVLGISLANYIYGYYLASLQSNIEYIETENPDATSRFLIEEHNDSGAAMAAKSYVSQLSKIALCRETTSQYIMTQEAYSLRSSNLEERRNCSAGVEEFKTLNRNIEETELDYPAFFNVEYDDIKQMNSKTLSQNKNLNFGISENKTCQNDLMYHYDCGEIIAKVPKINENYLINTYGMEEFINKITSVSSSLSINGSNLSVIQNGWDSLKEELLLAVDSYAQMDKSNVASGELNKIKMAEEIYYKRNIIELKKASYVYHQMILNSQTVGLSFITYEDLPFYNIWSDEFSKNYENFNALKNDWERINQLAKKIQKNYCQLNSQGLNNSHKLVKKLTSLSFSSGTLARCVDFDSMEVYGVDSEGVPIDKFAAAQMAEALVKEIQEEFEEISQDVFQRRLEVEISFIRSLEEMKEENLLNDIRKRGWLTMPTYIMEFSKDIKINNTYIKSLIGSNGFKPLQMEQNMVANRVVAVEQLQNENFIPYGGMSNVFRGFIDQSKESSIYNDNATFTKNLLQDNQEMLLRGEFTLLQLFDASLLDPIAPLKNAIGLEMIDNLGDAEGNMAIIDQCQADIDNCPIPKKDPIVELNRYGHYLIGASLRYFELIIGIKGLTSYKKGILNEKSTKNPPKAGVKESKITDKFKEVAKDTIGGPMAVFTGSLNILSEIASALAFLVVMMFFAGIFLAYILPLIPLLYFITGFLGWLLMVIQSLMIVPIWAVYFLKYKDNKDIIHKAGRTYGLQILLKPALMVIGLLFAWELIKVALFFINVTIFPLLNSMSSDNFILSLLQNVLFLMIFIYIIYTMISFTLNVMQTLSSQLLSLLDVDAADDSSTQMSEIMQYYILHAGMGLRDKIVEETVNTAEKFGYGFAKEKRILDAIKDIANKDPEKATPNYDDASMTNMYSQQANQIEEELEARAKVGNEFAHNEKLKRIAEEEAEEERRKLQTAKGDLLDKASSSSIGGEGEISYTNKGEISYTNEDGHKITRKNTGQSEEDLKEELQEILSEEGSYRTEVMIDENTINVKVGLNNSTETGELFDIQFTSGGEVVEYHDGKGNMIKSTETGITQEQLEEILQKEIDKRGTVWIS